MVLYVFKVVNGEIFALVYTTLLIIKLDFTHGYVLFLKIIFSVFFLIEKTFESMTLHYSILQTCFRNELDPYFHNCEFCFSFWV